LVNASDLSQDFDNVEYCYKDGLRGESYSEAWDSMMKELAE